MTRAPDPDGIEGEVVERLGEFTEDLPAERVMLNRALGGWRGILDSSLPAITFLILYTLDRQNLSRAIIGSVAVGAVLAIIRLVRRESLLQVGGGFLGIAVSALVASFTGQAADFFLPGILINALYGAGALISIMVGWPILGLMLGGIMGDFTGWRSDVELRRTYATATWIWVGVFGLRLVVQVPLYFLDWVGPLGVAKIVMGWPLYLLGVWFSFLIIRPSMAAARSRGAAKREEAATPAPDVGAADVEGSAGGAGSEDETGHSSPESRSSNDDS